LSDRRSEREEERLIQPAIDFEALLCPKSIAVIGATERPDTWGHWITRELLEGDFPGSVYPINARAGSILDRPAYPAVVSVPGRVDLAIIAIPAERVFDAVRDCVAKEVRAALIITAGFSEAQSSGRFQEEEMASYARAHGLRLVGPNVSGIMNLHYGLKAHPTDLRYLRKTPITFICQGGYAITDIAARDANGGRGFGKYLHTGNEADVTLVDCLEYCENDPETEAVCLYIEGLRDARRFLRIARRMAPHKPIVAFKAAVTPDGTRAALSHTGALAGSAGLYRDLFRQAGVVMAPSFELVLTIAHALMEMPRLKQPAIGITTMGGSWGVMQTDALAQRGLRVPELPPEIQEAIRRMGMPDRASVRNPVDFGAAAGSISLETRLEIVRTLLSADAIGGVVLHGYGAPGFLSEESPPFAHQRAREDKAMIRSVPDLQRAYAKPVVLATAMTPQESQVVQEMVAEGIRFEHRLGDVAAVLAALRDFANMHPTQ
jgi:acetyltransferase